MWTENYAKFSLTSCLVETIAYQLLNNETLSRKTCHFFTSTPANNTCQGKLVNVKLAREDDASFQKNSFGDVIVHLTALLLTSYVSGPHDHPTLLPVLDVDEDATFDFPIILVGFSKGCVVLNQIVHELSNVTVGDDAGLRDFVSRISAMFWLDGGHGGESNTWITDEKYLYHLAWHIPSIKVHVTPYQIDDETRPWIGEEQGLFVEKLRTLGANIKVKKHFQDKEPSLAYHFKLIDSF